CTVGVASGRATEDGRPMIWKTRDAGEVNNEVFYNTSGTYKYIAVFNAGDTTSPWMGVTEKGFAILNSLSTDLKRYGNSGEFVENGMFMRVALNMCADVVEFQSLLDRTNIKGRKTCANYFVLDSSGAAAIFETANNVYWKFDATDEEVAPEGYLLRTNFAFNGGGTGGIERYRRTTSLMRDFYMTDKISHEEILRTQMRDFVDAENNPIDPLAIMISRTFSRLTRTLCRSQSFSEA
ncbi:MAG: carcinine hydrolase/isopenicillin-N N-acyltransferase family protein, partial [Clostridiales bacterium]|nr:carcinine hydrolase/isopenicillin-N N-acyltransferase family protein [Clostridiales bacterium]